MQTDGRPTEACAVLLLSQARRYRCSSRTPVGRRLSATPDPPTLHKPRDFWWPKGCHDCQARRVRGCQGNHLSCFARVGKGEGGSPGLTSDLCHWLRNAGGNWPSRGGSLGSDPPWTEQLWVGLEGRPGLPQASVSRGAGVLTWNRVSSSRLAATRGTMKHRGALRPSRRSGQALVSCLPIFSSTRTVMC